MSLTLPAAYSAATKQGNIQENWLIQLGYFNGDAQGEGEGGWDAVLQDGGAANLIDNLGSELIGSGSTFAVNGHWSIRDQDGGADGWSAASNAALFDNSEVSSIIANLTGDDIDAGKYYTLTFTVKVQTLNLLIGADNNATGTSNLASETYVAYATYAAGTHTVNFQATVDRSHLWITANHIGSGAGSLDDMSLKVDGYGTAETEIDVDDGTVFQDGDFIKIDSEIMKITSTDSNELTVLRSQMDTTAAIHTNNTALYWNNFTAISGSNTTVDSVFYRGVVTRQPSVRTAISLVKSTAKVSNISISLVNMQYKGDDFSAELLLGTRTYLNKDVRVYIQLNGNSTLSSCLHIYTGRLHGIKHSDSGIRLSIKAYSPWDRVDYPATYSAEKVLAPLSFGTFTGNDSAYAGTGTDNWRPVPFTKATAASAFFTTGVTADSSFSKTSQYVPSRDGFVPFTTASTATSTIGSVETLTVSVNGEYKFFVTPTSDSQHSTQTGWTETNIAQSYDLNTGNAGKYHWTENISTGQVRIHVQRYVIPDTGVGAQIVMTYRISNYSKATDVASLELTANLSTAADSKDSDQHVANTGSDQTLTLITTANTAYVDLTLTAEIEEEDDTSGGIGVVDLDAYEITISNAQNEDKLEAVYVDVGPDVKNYTSGGVANIHEAHRSLLHGALGLTDTPTNWSALNTERVGSPSAWTIRYWQNDQTPIKRLLDRLQYEGQFIYLYERGAGKYIFIADSPSSIATITQDDISSFSIDQVDFDELETKHVIDYDPHPAKSREYRSQATQTSSNRTDYNFATNENVINVTLKALAASVSGGSAQNDDWATYRQKLFGAIKLTVRFNLINPAFTNIEVGDIIDFGTMPVDPGGGSWSGKNFIITRTRRSPGLLSVTAREV